MGKTVKHTDHSSEDPGSRAIVENLPRAAIELGGQLPPSAAS